MVAAIGETTMDKISNFVLSAFQKIIIIFATVGSLVILIACLPILLIFAVHYCLTTLLAWKIRPDLWALSGLDPWFALEPVYTHPYTNIVWHLICEGSISVEELRRKFSERVLEYSEPERGLVYRRLRHKLTTFMGYFFWEPEENFDINQHVRLYDYNDEPGLSLVSSSGSSCTEKRLVEVSGKLCTKGYKIGTSPWELLLIPNFKSTGDGTRGTLTAKTVLCLRIHHSLGDGRSILEFMARLFQYQLPSPTSAILSPEPKPLTAVILKELMSLLVIPYYLARGITEGLDGRNAWNPGRRELSGENVVFCSGRIPWEQVRAIMKKYGVSSNAAVYSISAGAVVRLMKEAGLEIPRTTVATFVPYPKPNHPGGLANHVVGTFFSFNPQLHRGARLVHHVGKQIRRLREGDRTAETVGRIQALSFLFPVWLWQLISRRPVAPTFIFSNFIGPQEVMETGGLRLVNNICSMGHDPATGTYGLMTSDLGKLRIVLNMDRRIFKGAKIPTGFSEHVETEIEDFMLNHDARDNLVRGESSKGK